MSGRLPGSRVQASRSISDVGRASQGRERPTRVIELPRRDLTREISALPMLGGIFSPWDASVQRFGGPLIYT